jgi:hypothetical protein
MDLLLFKDNFIVSKNKDHKLTFDLFPIMPFGQHMLLSDERQSIIGCSRSGLVNQKEKIYLCPRYNNAELTWAAALARLSKAREIAAACCGVLVLADSVSIVSVLILQSIRRLVVVLDDEDDDEDDEEGGERKRGVVAGVGVLTLDDDVRILCRVLC